MLSEHEQFDTVFTKGEFVDSVIDGHIKYALYSLSMFWVEVRYNADTNKILDCLPFLGGKGLDRFSNIPNKI